MGRKKRKKKKQASVDTTQLVKGGLVCAGIVAVIYFFNSLDGSAPSSTTVSLVTPQGGGQNVNQNINQVDLNRRKQAPVKQQAPPQGSDQPKPGQETPQLTPADVDRDAQMIAQIFADKNKPVVPTTATSLSEVPAEMLQVELPKSALKLPDLLERVKPSLVKLTFLHSTGKSEGTGFIVSNSGLLITGLHLLEGVRGASADLSDGTSAEIEGYRLISPEHDIAILQITPPERGLKLLPLSNQLSHQEAPVAAFGAFEDAVQGKITAVPDQRKMRTDWRLPFAGNWLETSLPVSPNHQGGPVVNPYGLVVAVNLIQLSSGKEHHLALASKDILPLINASRNQEVKKLTPNLFAGFSNDLKRRMARNIAGTDRAQELFANIKQIRLLQNLPNSLVASGVVREIVNNNARRSFSKSGFELIPDNPAGSPVAENIPTLQVILTAEPQRIRAKDSFKVSVQAELIVIDPQENSSNRFVIIWKGKKTDIGSILAEGVSPEIASRILSPKLKSYFDRFRTAQSKSKRLLKQDS